MRSLRLSNANHCFSCPAARLFTDRLPTPPVCPSRYISGRNRLQSVVIGRARRASVTPGASGMSAAIETEAAGEWASYCGKQGIAAIKFGGHFEKFISFYQTPSLGLGTCLFACLPACSQSAVAVVAEPEGRELTFTNSRGEKLVGILVDTGSTDVVLLCHG